MKIKIEADGRRFTVPLPLGMLANGFTARLFEKYIKVQVNVPDVQLNLTVDQLLVLLKELKRAKKVFRSLTLVDVRTADKQRVLITL
jgi:hypothetical protein